MRRDTTVRIYKAVRHVHRVRTSLVRLGAGEPFGTLVYKKSTLGTGRADYTKFHPKHIEQQPCPLLPGSLCFCWTKLAVTLFCLCICPHSFYIFVGHLTMYKTYHHRYSPDIALEDMKMKPKLYRT